jgi:hypothetical protein
MTFGRAGHELEQLWLDGRAMIVHQSTAMLPEPDDVQLAHNPRLQLRQPLLGVESVIARVDEQVGDIQEQADVRRGA